MTGRAFLRYGLVSLLWVSAAWGQSSIPFNLLFTEDNSAVTLPNGSGVTFVAPVGQTRTATIVATYTGVGQVTIPQSPNIVGSTAFTTTVSVAPPITLGKGQSFQFTIQFVPKDANQSTAQLNIPFTETSLTTPPTTTTGAIQLSLTGTAPSLVLSYILAANQNVVQLQPDGTIPFPSTPVGTNALAVLNITNRGSGSGTVNGISSTGAAFKISGLPLFPISIGSGQTLPVGITYTPTGVGSDTGQIVVTFDAGPSITVNLQGTGSNSSFIYQVLQTSGPLVVVPGGTIPVPDTNVGQTTSVTLRIQNSGNANGTIGSVNIVGQGFQITNPQPLPQILAPNASISFNISFTPTQPGAQTGSLFINSDTFSLSGKGLGPQLAFSYVAGGSTITLGPSNNSVVFSPVAVTQTGTTVLDVKNTGTLAATISNIGIGENNSPFSLSGVPALPVTLQPGSDFLITIAFAPTTLGFSNGTLRFDTTSIQLIGSGTQPPPLPSYTFQGPSGTVSPIAQLGLGLTLSAPYPLAISGTLTLAVTGNLPPDPAVQFSSGGASAAFTIPANSTKAVFANQATQIFLQTGTVASTITITPAFTTQAGGINITPTNPLAVQLTVAQAAPVLLSSTVVAETTNGFSLSIVGYSTTRSISMLNVQLTPTAGFNVPVSQFAVDLTQLSAVWFPSAAAQSFGGQFTLTVPFNFKGTVGAGQSLLNAISAVAVSIANSVGSSNTITTPLP
jgi:hypothetical protein